MAQILVSGSLAYDHIMDFPGFFRDHFMPDKLHNINVSFNIDTHTENFGGTGGNIAYNLALLGEKPSIIATAGNDFTRYQTYLEAAGVDTSSIIVNPSLQTAFAYILTDKGDNQIAAFHPGASADAYSGDLKLSSETLAIIAPGSLKDMRSFPQLFREKGVRFLFDPGQVIPALSGEDLKNGITGAEAVFANDYEFSLIEIKTGWKAEDIVKVAKTLVITLGVTGSRVITESGEITIAATAAHEAKDPTGAGDGYRAGYIKGLRSQLTPVECAQLGSVVATYVVENLGTQAHRFTLDDVVKRYETTYGSVPQLI